MAACVEFTDQCEAGGFSETPRLGFRDAEDERWSCGERRIIPFEHRESAPGTYDARRLKEYLALFFRLEEDIRHDDEIDRALGEVGAVLEFEVRPDRLYLKEVLKGRARLDTIEGVFLDIDGVDLAVITHDPGQRDGKVYRSRAEMGHDHTGSEVKGTGNAFGLHESATAGDLYRLSGHTRGKRVDHRSQIVVFR